MKYLILSLLLVAATSCVAQTKDTFVLKSFPTYDQFGNYYEVTKSFDHIPTQQDSICFKEESKVQIKVWMDSLYKVFTPSTPKSRKKYKKG